MMTRAEKTRQMDYACEEDHRTITKAEEVRADPKRMAGVLRHHRKQTRALSRVGRAVGARR